MIAACWLISATGAWAQSSDANLQAAAEAALVAGDIESTIALSRSLLDVSPDNFAAAFLLALGLAEMGANADAARAAANAYRLAPTETDKLRAAQLAGSAWYADGSYSRSQFWLRRAANHIQTDDDARAVGLAYQRSRSANPFAVQLGGWVAPSDNINNGAENEVFRLEGVPIDFILPPERLALSGIEYAIEGQITYRVSQSAKQRTTLGGYVFGRSYTLSDKAQVRLPDATGNDFALGIADVSLTHERQIIESLGPSALSANFGRIWYGGDPIWDYWTGTAQQGIALSASEKLTLRAAYTHQTPLFSGASDVKITDLSTTLRTTFSNDDNLQLTFAQTYSDGGFENIYSEYRIAAGYDFAQPLWNTGWSASATLGVRSYDTFPTTLDGRRDTFGSVGVTAVFGAISYWGFSPQLSLVATRTQSSAEEFTSSGVQARIGISSNF